MFSLSELLISSKSENVHKVTLLLENHNVNLAINDKDNRNLYENYNDAI